MSNDQNMVISYLSLREAIGVLGLSLPIVLWLGGWFGQSEIQPSISHFYHSPMRDIFVGYLFAISVFLMAYRGYDVIDLRSGRIAGSAGVGVALLPTVEGFDHCLSQPATETAKLIGNFHYLSAGIFFLTLAFFCFFLFTKGQPGATPTPMKLWRNRVYRICGSIIVLCLAAIAILTLSSDQSCPTPQVLPPIFTLEAIAVIAFGFSWLVKGEAILQDRP